MAEVVQNVYGLLVSASEFVSVRHNAIPQMEVERNAASMLGLTVSQIRFVVAFFAAVAFGLGIRVLKSPTARYLYALVTGVLLVYYPFGNEVLHVLPPATLTYLAMLLFPKKAGVLAWAINFPYLIMLHVAQASGMSWSKGEIDFTGGMMVLVLKLVSVAVCYQDHRGRKPESLTDYQKAHKLEARPGPLAYLSYIFCLGNLLGGPWMEVKEFKDFMERKGAWDAQSKPPSPLLPSLRCMGQALVFMFAYLQLSGTWNVRLLTSNWYLSQNIVVRLFCMPVIGWTSQFKYFFSWKLAEASLTLAGINFDGYDKQGKATWGRMCNVNYLGVQLADSARNVPLQWNICTGKFLRRYVYERIVPSNRKPGFQHLLATQLVSGVWHGLYPGYLLFFASSAMWIYSSSVVFKAEQGWPPALRDSLPWKFIKIVWTNTTLNYLAMAFDLLEYDTSIAAWSNVAFIPHAILLAICLYGFLGPKPRRPQAKDQAKDVASKPAQEREAKKEL